ncbi:MAG: pseudouridine synthase [Bdellovibrionales bacterium]
MKEKTPQKIRLNKYLAQWGDVSRRKADELIKKGDIFLNGSLVKNLGTFIDPKKDHIRIKNKKILATQITPIYMMFNKPENVLTTTKDPKNRLTVMDFIKKNKQRIFPVGRLDWNSEGLLLLTNDGDFSQKVLHPTYKIKKTYLVKIQGRPSPEQLKKLLKGVTTPIGKMKASYVKKVPKTNPNNQWIKIIIAEGKNRQIRHMFFKLGYRILKLRRVAIGRLKLSRLKKGTYVLLKPADIEKVFINPKELSRR